MSEMDNQMSAELFDQLPMPAILVDVKCRIRSMNQAARTFLNYPMGQDIGS